MFQTHTCRALFISVLSIFSVTSHGDDSATVDSMNLGMFKPLPEISDSKTNPVTAAKVKLGKELYLDGRLSVNKKISCNSCHRLDTYGVDNEATSPGHEGKRGDRNSPSSFNAALHIAQFWDGRAADVEEQALGPILNPVEMGMAADVDAIERVRSDENYQKLFAVAFPNEKEPITFKNIGNAIGAFERTLLTPSRFDDYLKGDKSALTSAEKTGLKRFIETGCVSCHNGVTIGGQIYMKLGLVKPYTTKDLGRFNLTKNESDRFVFKVPSLRNVEKTAPYLHDGSIPTLEKAVEVMAIYQSGRELKQEEITEIVTFLKALTGKMPDTAL